jgi:hypothetical protein
LVRGCGGGIGLDEQIFSLRTMKPVKQMEK